MKSRVYVPLSILTLLLTLLAGAPAFAQTATGTITSALEAPNRQATIVDSFYGARPAALPHWEGQYFVSGLAEVTASKPNVALYGQDGNRVREAKIWFPDSVRVRISDATVTPAGNIVASGYAARSDGSMAFFIAKTDLSGAITQVVRTNPFKAEKVCALDEDTVWSFGMELDKDDAGQDYRMLRNYSFAQGLIHSYVPRHTIKIPAGGIVVGSSPYWLRCSGTKVAVYVGEGLEYLQLNVAHNTLDSFPVKPIPGNMMVTGFALTDAGHVYASLNVTSDGTLGLRGLFELKYDAPAKQVQWVPVQSTLTHFQSWQKVQDDAFSDLLGTDGTNLIYSRVRQNNALFWARPVIAKAVATASTK